MTFKEWVAKRVAKRVFRQLQEQAIRAVDQQKTILQKLLEKGSATSFGKDHGLKAGDDYYSFKSKVPIRDYEGLKAYFDRVKAGEEHVLWPGKPIYLSKTSGTTSGTKYIPITKDSMGHHITAARNALLCYIETSGNSAFVNNKMIFLQGSPELDKSGSVPTGRLSGIVANYVPAYLQKNRLPSYATNCIEDWEQKVDSIVDETWNQPMGLISGIPSWVQMYYERLTERTGKKIGELFPQFSLFVYGGVNFDPYRKRFDQLIGRSVDVVQTYPASEGFIAFQDRHQANDLLLNTNAGLFFEFIEPQYLDSQPDRRLMLDEVVTGVNYAIIVSSNAGLWAYSLGDTVRFTSIKPYRIVVTGRIKHFTSAFGEHVIAEEVDRAMQEAVTGTNAVVREFTLAPQINPEKGLPYHEWFVEFEEPPAEPELFLQLLDQSMQRQNVYYRDLVQGSVLRPLIVSSVKAGSFTAYMKTQGKLGGQNKIPRLQNNRSIGDFLTPFVERQFQ